MFDHDLKALCRALYICCIESQPESYAVWKSIWISNNGEIGRKKSVGSASIARALSIDGRDDIDLYAYVFSIESALVFLVEISQDSFGLQRSSDPISRLFQWWGKIISDEGAECAQRLRVAVSQKVQENPYEYIASDPFRSYYHDLLPKSIRHTLGAYLTPPDLCDFVLAEVGIGSEEGWVDCKVVEPNCGLGAFPCAIFRACEESVRAGKQSKNQCKDFFEQRFYGIEKNIASALISKGLVRCMIAYFKEDSMCCVPQVYCGDSIYICESSINRSLGVSKIFEAPETSIAGCIRYQGGTAGRAVDVFDGEKWVPVDVPLDDACKRLWGIQAEIQDYLILEAGKISSIRLVDKIIGNPPWVNWENIDPQYRSWILPSWPLLGLFGATGRDRSFSKEDLSVFATYSSCLRFAKIGASVCFLLPQSIFQARKNAKGFRLFKIGEIGPSLRVERVVDFSDYVAFGDAKNRTASLLMRVGKGPTEYPVDYKRFISAGRASGIVGGRYESLQAMPSSRQDISSNWALYGKFESLNGESREVGIYRARTGVFTGGANAIFYVKVKEERGGLLLVENDTERAKIKVPTQQFEIERSAVFPFMKGRDLSMWSSTRPEENGIILLHTPDTKIRPIAEKIVSSKYPHAFSYLQLFRENLEHRGSLTALDRANVAEGFYAMLRVGDYTFAPYKVAWRYIAKNFICAVVSPSRVGNIVRPTVLQEKLISIPFFDEAEAYFVCGYLSATKTTAEIERRIVGTQVSVHVIEDLHIPRYDPASMLHRRVSDLCREGHFSGGLVGFTREGLDDLVAQIDTVNYRP